MRALFCFFSLMLFSQFSLTASRFEQLLKASQNYPENEICEQTEILFHKNWQSWFLDFEKEMMSQKNDLISKRFAKTIEFSLFSQNTNRAFSQLILKDENLSIHVQSKPEKKQVGLPQVQQDFKKYLAQFKKIENTDLQIMQFKILDADRYSAQGRLMINGKTTQSLLRSDRFNVDMIVNKSFKFEKFVFDYVESVHSETTDQAFKLAGWNQKPRTDLRLEAIRRGGYALAVGDFDQDQHQDLLVGHHGPLQVFKGDGKGSFKEVKVKGLPDLTLVKSAAWVDLDNDHDQDLVIVRFLQDNDQVPNSFKNAKLSYPTTSVVIFENLSPGVFKEIKQQMNSAKVTLEKAMPLALADFNQDGLLDLYIGYPGANDFTSFTKANKPEKYGHIVQAVYLNKGGLHFEAAQMKTGLSDLYEVFNDKNIIYPHSALAFDVDDNRTQDLIVIDDRDQRSPIYINQGQAQFKESSEKLRLKNRGWGMGAAAADVNHDGVLDIAFTAISDPSESRLARCKSIENKLSSGLTLNLSQKDPKTKDVTFSLWSGNDFDYPGVGTANLEFLDFDLDGQQDIYVTNGLWSGPDKFKSIDIFSPFRLKIKDEVNSMLEDDYTSTRSFIMETLQEKYKGKSLSMGGYQSNRLYKQVNGHFYDVAYVSGVASMNDGYGVARGDFNEDGIPDLVLRNADPGTDLVKSTSVDVYLGQKRKNKSLALALIAQYPLLDAIGSRVTVKVKGLADQTQVLMANNGCLQSEKILFFGLGREDHVESVEITWPNNQTEKIIGLKAGRHLIQQKNLIPAQTNKN